MDSCRSLRCELRNRVAHKIRYWKINAIAIQLFLLFLSVAVVIAGGCIILFWFLVGLTKFSWIKGRNVAKAKHVLREHRDHNEVIEIEWKWSDKHKAGMPKKKFEVFFLYWQIIDFIISLQFWYFRPGLIAARFLWYQLPRAEFSRFSVDLH